jgi:hypothetical protein
MWSYLQAVSGGITAYTACLGILKYLLSDFPYTISGTDRE